MRLVFGLLFLAWGSSIIFSFNFDFGKYVFPLILIGIGINIIFKDNETYKRYKKNRRVEKYERKAKKYEERMKTVNDDKGDDTHE